MRIAIVRHGETVDNVNNIIQGHLPGELTEAGKEGAGALALRLRNAGRFQKIISSDLHRAVQTAEVIGSGLNITNIEYTNLLRERHYGHWQGKSLHEFKRYLVTAKQSFRTVEPPSGELYALFAQRVIGFWREHLEKQTADTIMVTHAGVINVIIEHLRGSIPPTTKNAQGFLITITDTTHYTEQEL